MEKTGKGDGPDENTPSDYDLKMPCVFYEMEYDQCGSRGNKKLHKFIFGSDGPKLDCSQWKKDYRNCNRWEADRKNNRQAILELLESEKDRRKQRQMALIHNNVWQLRSVSEPPRDWNSPLPAHLMKSRSFLAEMADHERKNKSHGGPTKLDFMRRKAFDRMN